MVGFPNSAPANYGSIALIKRLLRDQGRANWKKYAVAFVMMGVVAACTSIAAYLLGRVINEAYLNRSFPGVVTVACGIFAVFFAKGLAGYGQSVILQQIANGIVAENQRKLFAKLLRENLGFFSDRHSTEFVARLNAGAAAVGQALNLIIAAVGRDLMSLVGLAIVMVSQDPIMTVAGLLFAPPALFIIRKLVKRIYAIARAQFHGGAQIMETMTEMLQGIRIVKAFALENTMRERFDRHVNDVRNESDKLARVSNRASPVVEGFTGFILAVVTVYGGYRTIVLGASPGEFFSFVAAFMLAYEPMKRLTRLNMELNNHFVGVRILFEILDSPASEPADEGKPALRAANNEIRFSNVSFAYRLEESVLRDMSFTAEHGKMTALVGPSGGGKSTIFNLLMRFYDSERGRISIGGEEITAVSRASLRQHLAYVGQEVFLFRGSIRDNIAFGRPAASESEIIAAAKGAYAHDFILSFPQGYDTQVGEHGLQLSGGQRQRIAIARALIKDAPIVLMDEATASLDSESELQVREAMDHLCASKTTLVIAHRLHTIAHAHTIHVVEDGRVVESGRHDELLHKNGRYAAFYRLQLKQQEAREPVAATA